MNRMNSRSLLPSTSVKLLVFQVITVVNRSRFGGSSVCHRSQTTGCHVRCQMNSPVDTSDSAVPMFAPKVNNRWNPRKKSTYHLSPFAIASSVNTGSESTNTRLGMRAYSRRQNQESPDRFTNRSASEQYSRTDSRRHPGYVPSQLSKHQWLPRPTGSSA